MPQAAYPTTTDVESILTGLALSAPSNLATILAGVVSDFEGKTGYRPFLADTTPTEWTFDPPYKDGSYILDLAGAFIDVDEVAIDGSAIDAEAYNLLPLNAAGESRGWNAIRFLMHPGTVPASITVTGKRGLYEEIPDDVFDAIANECAGRSIPFAVSGTGIEKRVKQGMREVEYDSKDGEYGKARLWAKQFTSTIRKYQLI